MNKNEIWKMQKKHLQNIWYLFIEWWALLRLCFHHFLRILHFIRTYARMHAHISCHPHQARHFNFNANQMHNERIKIIIERPIEKIMRDGKRVERRQIERERGRELYSKHTVRIIMCCCTYCITIQYSLINHLFGLGVEYVCLRCSSCSVFFKL